MKTREIVLVFGKTGSGKSTFTRAYIQNFPRVIVIDPMEEYEGIIFYDFYTLNEYHKINQLESFIYVCRFSSDLEIEYLFKFSQAIENNLLVLEECSIYVSPQAKSNEFLNIVRFGRHKQISIIGISRRATELHNDLKAMVNKIISFKQTHPIDLQNMSKLGFQNLDSLPDYEYQEIDF